jgi:hypothetical protein
VSRKATLAEARGLLMVCCRADPDGFLLLWKECCNELRLAWLCHGWDIVKHREGPVWFCNANHFDIAIMGRKMEVRSSHVIE